MPLPTNKLRITLLLTAVLLAVHPLFSQARKDTIAKIISLGLGVYAKDAYSFKPAERNTIDSVSQHLEDVSKAISFLESNSSSQLKKVGGFAKDWWSKGNALNADGQYKILVHTIEEKLLNGGDGPDAKNWRKENVPGLFTRQVNAYLLGPEDAAEQEETVASGPATTINPAGASINQSTAGNNNNSMIALVLAVLSLLGVAAGFYLFSKQKTAYEGFRIKNRAELDQLKTDINQWKKSAPVADAVIKPGAEKKTQELEARIALLEGRLNPAEKPVPVAQNLMEQDIIIDLKKTKAEPETEELVLYAKLPDMPNGFSQSVLSASQNGEKVYQLETKGNTAIFMIANDAAAQKYVLSDYRYYLEKGCNFFNEPTPNCKIYTKAYGELTKNSNSWIIQKKAQIEFV